MAKGSSVIISPIATRREHPELAYIEVSPRKRLSPMYTRLRHTVTAKLRLTINYIIYG